MTVLLALVAGACVAVAVAAATVEGVVVRLRLARFETRPPAGLAIALERAGWSEKPGRFSAGLVLATVAAGGLAAVVGASFTGLATVPALALTAATAPPLLALLALRKAASQRRERLGAELGALLQLLCVELTAGTPAIPALEAVLSHSGGPLAAEVRSQLAGSRVAGSLPLDERLTSLAARLGLPALEGFATILALSREFGMEVTPGIRALAADLVRERRNEVIAASRRALNRVLIPAAVGVLLPFMAILLFPAVITLFGSLR